MKCYGSVRIVNHFFIKRGVHESINYRKMKKFYVQNVIYQRFDLTKFVYYIELGKKSLPFACKCARINAVFRNALPEDDRRNAT